MLYEQLRGHHELSAVKVTAILLQICRSLSRALDHALQRRHETGAPYGPYLAFAEAIIADAQDSRDPEFLHQRELEQIADLLAAWADQEDLALRARDVATVLDERRGGHFFSFSRAGASRATLAIPSRSRRPTW